MYIHLHISICLSTTNIHLHIYTYSTISNKYLKSDTEKTCPNNLNSRMLPRDGQQDSLSPI